MSTSPILHLLCGKIASGKSSLARELANKPDTVLISEDEWLANLFSDQMQSITDYVRCATKLENAMAPHIENLLRAGLSVVLDFHANTKKRRAWMADIIRASGASHQLHLLDVADDVCIERLHARNAKGNHPFSATQEQFFQISSHFVTPTSDEGFNIIMHHPQDQTIS